MKPQQPINRNKSVSDRIISVPITIPMVAPTGKPVAVGGERDAVGTGVEVVVEVTDNGVDTVVVVGTKGFNVALADTIADEVSVNKSKISRARPNCSKGNVGCVSSENKKARESIQHVLITL